MRSGRWMISFHVNFVDFAKCLPFPSGVQQIARVAFLTPISPVNEARGCMQCVKTYVTHPRKRRAASTPKCRLDGLPFLKDTCSDSMLLFRVSVCLCIQLIMFSNVLYIYIYTYLHAYIQTDKQVDRQTDRHTYTPLPAMEGYRGYI